MGFVSYRSNNIIEKGGMTFDSSVSLTLNNVIFAIILHLITLKVDADAESASDV